MYIINDPVMTLTYFTARSTLAGKTPAFEWGKVVKLYFEGKNLKEMDRRFMILKKFGPQGLVCPHQGQYTCRK